MQRCKNCGGEVFSIEKEIKKNKYRLDKDKNKIQLIGYVKKNTDYIYECEKCPNVAFYESELEDIAYWVEEEQCK